MLGHSLATSAGTAAVSALTSSRYWSSEELRLTMLVNLFVDAILQNHDRYSLASRKTERQSFKLTFIRRPYDLDPG